MCPAIRVQAVSSDFRTQFCLGLPTRLTGGLMGWIEAGLNVTSLTGSSGRARITCPKSFVFLSVILSEIVAIVLRGLPLPASAACK